METVKALDGILRNLESLERYQKSSDKSERVFWENLIKRGRCFVVWESHGQFTFGPSRFVGYLDNDMLKHKANREKDGRVTNKVIKSFLKECVADKLLETEFVRVCQNENIEPARIQRKYWQIQFSRVTIANRRT